MGALSAGALAAALTILAGGVLAGTRNGLRAGLLAQALGMLLLGVVGLSVLIQHTHVGSAFRSQVRPALGLDPLSGFFLAVLGLTAVPTLAFARDYLPCSGGSRGVGALTSGFLLALVGVLAARDITTFLAFWELMTLLPAAAILVAKRDGAVRSAVYSYLGVTHLGGAGVWIALLVLQRHGAIGDPGALAAAGSGVQTAVALAALIGFGTKAGFIPLHSWLPRAHPVAPAHLSALMSGMMIKVALYGLIRVEFEWLGATPRWLGVALVAVGVLSSIGGVLWALVQRDLKRLLAYSSIENVGIIALALGASLLLTDAGQRTWGAVAFAAALLHIANHAVFKTLLFQGAGAFERAVGSLDIDRLGGLLRRMPWTGGAFLVGSAAIAGLPPLNGFASEWLTLQSLLHAALHRPVAIALIAGVALAALAATAALALFCFVKVTGLVLLGAARGQAPATAVDPPFGMRAAMAILASACVVLGLVPALVLPTLISLAPNIRHVGFAGDLGLSLPGTGAYPALGVALALLLLTAGLARARGTRRTAAAPSWACGQELTPALGWTSTGFTKPLRLVLAGVLRPQRTIEVRESGGMVEEIIYSAHVPSLVDTKLYEPAIRAGLRAAAVARRLQTGNVRTYAAYLLGLVIVLLLLARTGVL